MNIQEFKSLKKLKLKSYELEFVPDWLKNITTLQYLDISETQIFEDTYKLAIKIHEELGIADVKLPRMEIR